MMRRTRLPFLSEDQESFIDGIGGLLDREAGVEVLRSWPTNRSRLDEALADFGIPGMLVPTDLGGLGLGPVELVALAVELGRVAAPLPTIDTVLAGAVLARFGSGDARQGWLEELVDGRLGVVVSTPQRRYVSGGDHADAVLVERARLLHLVRRERCTLAGQPSTDRLRNLARVDCTLDAGDVVANDPSAARTLASLGALATAGLLVGLSSRMVADATEYAAERHQFGRPIGSFQAIQHRLAESAVLLERATVACFRAADDASDDPLSVSTSVARIASGDAARRTSVHVLQTFGGIGFTEEHHLHFWLKRAKALESEFGSVYHHREALLAARGCRRRG